MKLSSSRLQTESDVATNFWPHDRQLSRRAAPVRIPHRAAANLCELFVQELSYLVAGACQTDRLARVLFASLAPDQVRLRRLVLGLAQSTRGCLPALPTALVEEGLVLPSTYNVVIDVLLKPINPDRHGPMSIEPSGVAGARTVGAFVHVALHFEAGAAQSAEDAWLLGSVRLQQALAAWAAAWNDYLREVRRQEKSFRAQAYAAGL